VSGSKGTAVLESASAKLGSGKVTATGQMETSAGGGAFRIDTTLAGVEIASKKMGNAVMSGTLSWAGAPAASLLKGRITVEEATVTYDAGLADLLARRPRAVVVPTTTGPRSRVSLDIAAEIVEPVRVRSNLADLEFTGGIRAGGTLAVPSLTGGVESDGGSLRYLGQEFLVDRFSVVYTDPRRRVPFVDVLGTAAVESSLGEEYVVTIQYQGFAGETVPLLTSVPPLSEPDIVALLTFGDTMGVLTSGGSSGSAGESFGALARSAFVGGLFGVAESTARRWLNLDTVDVSGASLDTGDLADAQVTFGKRFGRHVSVDYTTELGSFSGQAVGLSWRLTDQISVETKADQEGNHAIGLKFRFRFE
jgi:autotransporter translocation and assembly factor TamB